MLIFYSIYFIMFEKKREHRIQKKRSEVSMTHERLATIYLCNRFVFFYVIVDFLCHVSHTRLVKVWDKPHAGHYATG